MVLTITFAALAFAALLGAGGLLVYRRVRPCIGSFLTFATAMAGLFLLLNLQFMAAAQLLTGVALAGAWLTANLSSVPDDPHKPALRYLPPAVLLGAAICWAVVSGTVGEPILISTPVWAAQATYLSALGQQLSGSSATLLLLVGLLVLACIAGAAYLIGQNGADEYEET